MAGHEGAVMGWCGEAAGECFCVSGSVVCQGISVTPAVCLASAGMEVFLFFSVLISVKYLLSLKYGRMLTSKVEWQAPVLTHS